MNDMNDDHVLDVVTQALPIKPVKSTGEFPRVLNALRGAAERVITALRAAGFEIVNVSDDRHQIEFRDDGWTIAHPIRERLDGSLFDCRARWGDDDPGLRGRFPFTYDADYDIWVVGVGEECGA